MDPKKPIRVVLLIVSATLSALALAGWGYAVWLAIMALRKYVGT